MALPKGNSIERSLFAFIWKHSKRDQLILLLVTLGLFPLLYLTLELPKRIINDAIGAEAGTVDVFGLELSQISFLMLLCSFFLLSVFAHGALKMRINSMKGVLAERLLRRLRYTLIGRILRFPAPYFEQTSQGELVSMVTAEAEPMGGLMGDALAQPVLQAGQMLTILGFLFVQSIAFRFAACAFIPLQAWLIPKLQRQINLLNKSRVIEVRALAGEIGESAEGAATLRTNGGWRYRMALISNRLGRLFQIRFEIYQKKFFMKFLNNFITQLTPFFFYAMGGYLVIIGEITVGALVAALAAYKDLSSPWKELLTYYNLVQDMKMRWAIITDRFAPPGMMDASLFEGVPDTIPRLTGDINLHDVSVLDREGMTALDTLKVTFPAVSTIAVVAKSEEDRRAFAQLLTREILPARGEVSIGEYALGTLHQATIARRIGHVTSAPVLFQGTLGENINIALNTGPQTRSSDTAFHAESLRAGNSPDPLEVPWLDQRAAGVQNDAQLQSWWIDLLNGVGLDGPLFERAMDQRLDAAKQSEFAKALVALRPGTARVVEDAGLASLVDPFEIDSYNRTLPVGENLMFAVPLSPVTAETLIAHPSFMDLLEKIGLESGLLQLAIDILKPLREAFGTNGTDHPLFRKLGIDAQTYIAALKHTKAMARGDALTRSQKAVLLTVPFVIPAEQIGSGLSPLIIENVLEARARHCKALRESMKDIFEPLRIDAPVSGLSVLENAVFGKIKDGADADSLRALISTHLRGEGLGGAMLTQLFDLPLTRGGNNLTTQLAEVLAIGRATVKRPDLLVLDRPLASFDAEVRDGLPARLRRQLPDTTIICLAPEFSDFDSFDYQFVLKQGRLSSVLIDAGDGEDQTDSTDLTRKLRALEQADLFAGLPRKQLRLLAFGARWYHAKPGDYVFHRGDPPSSGAYLFLEGEGALLDPRQTGPDARIATVGPGQLVGELGLIRNVPRAFDLRADGDLTCLRIGAEEFLAVVENDALTAYKLLQVVAGYVGTPSTKDE